MDKPSEGEKKMDPNENLKEQLEVAHELLLSGSFDPTVQRLAELVLALDEWLKKGGYSPVRWVKHCDHAPLPASIQYSGSEGIMDCLCSKCGIGGSFKFENHTAEIMWDE